MNPSDARPSDPWLRVIAWGAVIGSTLPEITWQESGHRVSFWFTAGESLLIVAVALALLPFPRRRGLTRFLLAIAALNFTWDFVAPALAGTNAVRAITDNASWGARLFLSRIFTLSGAVLASLTLIGSGITRRDLFLCRGNLAAPAQPIRFLGLRKPVPWTWFGPALILIFALALAPFLYLTVFPNFGASGRVVRSLPWILTVAAVNAASEEFQFRSLLLAHLCRVFLPGEAVLLTAAFFGLGHYYGQPSGPIGVVMAAFAGWLWGRSMIETRGGFWAFIIHMAQDVLIFIFLVVGAGM